MNDNNDVLFVYIRNTSEGRLIRVVWSADAKEFEDDDDWANVGTIQPRAFIESLLQDNKIIFAGYFCHDSDCAVHNEPAYPNGECNCSLKKEVRYVCNQKNT